MKLTLDFETYYAADYSLRKMAMWDYIRDPRFKVHGVSVRLDDAAPEWWDNRLPDRLGATSTYSATTPNSMGLSCAGITNCPYPNASKTLRQLPPQCSRSRSTI